MNEPTITCPNCKTEIKLTESLAAPLIQAARAEYEKKFTDKEAEVAQREAAVREQQAAIAKAKETIEQQIAERLKVERGRIAVVEAKRARELLSADLEQKTREIADLQQVLQAREGKLAEAQQAQAELIRKQRELDDARREIDLTIETRVQQSLALVRTKAKQEAEDGKLTDYQFS